MTGARAPTARGRMRVRRRGRHNAHGDGATRTHNTLSVDSTHVHVFYSFHPLQGLTLRIVRRPKQGDGAVCVIDSTNRRLKIPVWMLSPDSATVTIVERAHLSREALLKLVSLLTTLLDVAGNVHDTLLPSHVDGGKGGHRAAPTTDGPDEARRAAARADRRHDTRRPHRSHGPHAGGGRSRNRKEG